MNLVGHDFNFHVRLREQRNRKRLINAITIVLIIAVAYFAGHVIYFFSR